MPDTILWRVSKKIIVSDILTYGIVVIMLSIGIVWTQYDIVLPEKAQN